MEWIYFCMFQKMLKVWKEKEEDAVSYNALTLWAQIGWPVAIPNLDNAVVSWKPGDDDDDDDDDDDGDDDDHDNDDDNDDDDDNDAGGVVKL